MENWGIRRGGADWGGGQGGQIHIAQDRARTNEKADGPVTAGEPMSTNAKMLPTERPCTTAVVTVLIEVCEFAIFKKTPALERENM